MNLLDMMSGSVLGALGCNMDTFLRYFPAAETMYPIFIALGMGFLLLNFVWQLFRNFGLGMGIEAKVFSISKIMKAARNGYDQGK